MQKNGISLQVYKNIFVYLQRNIIIENRKNNFFIK